MRPRVKPINVFSILINHAIVIMIMSSETTLTTYLLKANYGLYGDDAAEVAGNLGFAGQCGSMATVLFIGPALDLFGRKPLTIGGLFIAGASMIAKPLFNHVLALYFLKVLTDVGSVPALYTPYPTDYVEKESLGLLSAGYFLICGQLATILSTSGSVKL